MGKVWRFNKDEIDNWVKANKPLEEFFITAEANIEGNNFLRESQREVYIAAFEFFSNPDHKMAINVLPIGCGKSGLISILPFGIAQGKVLAIAPN